MFLIDTQSKMSINQQLKTQILRLKELGVLNVDEKLPSVREMAVELGINPNTVQKAYSELEVEGVIYTLPKKGAFIAAGEVQNHDLVHLIQTIKEEKGISKQEWLEAIEEVYREV